MTRQHRGPVMIGDRIILPTPPGLWSAPREWAGETVFILGGGPSLAGFDGERLRGRRVIGVNEAGLTVCPWADVLFWADGRWLDWNLDRLGLHTGRYKVTRKAPLHPVGHDVKVVRHTKDEALASQAWAVAGACGGAMAINLAAHFGASRIVLLGFDMRPGNFHDRHRKEPKLGQHQDRFIPALQAMAEPLRRLGVEVLNATPGSALTTWPMVTLDEVI